MPAIKVCAKPLPRLIPQKRMFTARLNLDFTKIRAPIDGQIGRALITEGNLVSGGGGDATLLTFIVSTNPVHVYVDADERSVLKYRRQSNTIGAGQTPAQLAVADETDFPHQGTLDYIAPREDAATGTVTLRGVFQPGRFAESRIFRPHARTVAARPIRPLPARSGHRYGSGTTVRGVGRQSGQPG